MRYIGIDPGGNGGIAVIRGEKITCCKTGKPEDEVAEFLWMHTTEGSHFCVLEKTVSVIPPGRSAQGLVVLSARYGFLRGCLVTLGAAFETVPPQTWQKDLKLVKKRAKGETETETQKKNRHKQLAKELFPEVKIFHWNADALLLAHYAKLIHEKVCA